MKKEKEIFCTKHQQKNKYFEGGHTQSTGKKKTEQLNF